MKKLRLFALLAFAAASFSTGCDDYDDSQLKQQITEITDQVKALQVLTAALEARDYITSVTTTTVDGVAGYVIAFAKSPSITILNSGAGPIDDVDTSNEDYVVFTLSDGKTITLPRQGELFVGFDKYDTFYCAPAANEIALLLPTNMKAADYTSIMATITSNEGTSTDIQTRANGEGRWGVTVAKPTFGSDGIVVAGSAKVTITIPQNVTYYKALLKVTIVDKKGQEHSATRPVWFSTGNVVTTTAGNLSTAVADPTTTTSLTVAGTMNDADFKFLRESMPSLEVLDLSRTTLTALPVRAMAFYESMGLQSNTSLKTVILPETLTTIGDSAFAMCADLQQINIPASVRTLGRWMFEGCNSLSRVELPEGLTEIPASAFYACGIGSIRIPSTVMTIGGWAFNRCNNLTSIMIPASVTSLGESVLRECANLLSADVRANVNVLSFNFFYQSKKLRDIKLSSSITTLESNSFADTGLVEFAIPAHVSQIKQGAFCENPNLETVSIPAGAHMSFNLFFNCVNLKNVTIAEGVTEIGAEAFRGCTALTQLVLPSTITKIRDRAFQGCSALVSLTCKAPSIPELAEDSQGGLYNLHFYGINASCVLKTPAGSDYSAWSRYFGGGIAAM